MRYRTYRLYALRTCSVVAVSETSRIASMIHVVLVGGMHHGVVGGVKI